MCSCNKVNVFSLREHYRGNRIRERGRAKNNWSENGIFCISIPI